MRQGMKLRRARENEGGKEGRGGGREGREN